jgi:hypothetical protein
MFGLDPEKILAGLMKSMGVSVEEFTGFINTVLTEMRELRADRLAFRPASVKAYKDITERLSVISDQLSVISDRLTAIEALNPRPNTETTHERNIDGLNGGH